MHCVTVGFGLHDVTDKSIYEYSDIKNEPHALKTSNINSYLVVASDLIVEKSRHPICVAPEMNYESKPADVENLILTED